MVLVRGVHALVTGIHGFSHGKGMVYSEEGMV
jgi:hypothetical protein